MSRRHWLPRLILISLGVIAAVPILWAVFYFGVYLGLGNYRVRGHQEFAAGGVSQIEPAREMDRLFADCRHFITYGETPLFNSVAYFGDRYVLTMQVPVDIESASTGRMIGEPRFYLDEVAAVTVSPSGQTGATFSRNLNFDAEQWRQVFDSGGDFSTIGFHVDMTAVPDFQKYAAAGRPSN